MSGWPSASHILMNRLSLPAAMMMSPSFVLNAWNGVIVGWRAPSGPGIRPRRVAHHGILEQRDLASNIAMSTLVALAGPEAVDECGIDRDRGVEARADVADRHADARRLAAGEPVTLMMPPMPCIDHVVGRILGIGTGVTEAGGRGVDQLRILLDEAFPSR